MALINNRNIQDIRNGFNRYFPEDIPEKSFIDGSYSSGDFKWKNRDDFINFIGSEVKIYINIKKSNKLELAQTIRQAQQAFEQRVLTPERSAEANIPENIKELTQESEKVSAARKKIIAESNRQVRLYITKAENNKLHDLPEASKEKVLSKSIPELTQEIEKSISKSLPGLSDDQIKLMAKDAAYKAVDAVANRDKYVELARESAVLRAISTDATVLPKIIKDKETLESVRQAAKEISVLQDMQTKSARMIWTAFDKETGESIFPSSKDFEIEVSGSSGKEPVFEFRPEGLLRGYETLLNNNTNLLKSFGDVPVNEFQKLILSRANIWIEGQISTNFPQLSRFFTSTESQAFFSQIGVGTVTVDLSGPLGTFFIENPATLPIANSFLEGFGVTIGAGGGAAAGALAASTAATATEISITGGIMASEAFLGGAAVSAAGATSGAAAGAAAGTAIAPVVGTAIGAVVGLVAPKAVGMVKNLVVKAGKGIVVAAGVVFGGGIAFAAGSNILVGGLVGGTATWGVSTLATGGISGVQASLASGVSAIGTGINVVFSTFLAGIAAPVIGFLIGFPIVVALILFIINSGAYVVPQGSFNLSGSISISGTPLNIDCSSLDKNLEKTSYAAELIYCALSKSGMNPLLKKDIPGLQRLASVLNSDAIDALARSAPVDGHLQCIGYVSAVAGQAYSQNWGQVSNACSYVNHAPSGYKYVSGTQGMKSGDIFVIGSKDCGLCGTENAKVGSCGHIGVVISVDGVGVSCADANAAGTGKVRVDKGCLTTNDITGYIRRK